MLCPICEKARMIKKLVPFSFKNHYFGKYEADVCPKCKEVLFTEESSKKIDKKAVSLKVWGLDDNIKMKRIKELKKSIKEGLDFLNSSIVSANRHFEKIKTTKTSGE